MILELSDLITQYLYSYTKFATVTDGGLLEIAYGITTFYIFGYLAARGKFDNPHQIAFEGLFPAIVVVLFLAILGVPNVFKGMALFAVYYATIRLTSSMSNEDFFRIVIYITLALGISAFLTKTVAFFYLLMIYTVYYIQGNMRIRDNEKKAKQKAKETKIEKITDTKNINASEKKNDTKNSTGTKPIDTKTSLPLKGTGAKTSTTKPIDTKKSSTNKTTDNKTPQKEVKK